MRSDDVEDVGPCRIVRTSTKAALVRTDVGWSGWIPFSNIHVDDLPDVEPGAEVHRLRVATWYVEREGIE